MMAYKDQKGKSYKNIASYDSGSSHIKPINSARQPICYVAIRKSNIHCSAIIQLNNSNCICYINNQFRGKTTRI